MAIEKEEKNLILKRLYNLDIIGIDIHVKSEESEEAREKIKESLNKLETNHVEYKVTEAKDNAVYIYSKNNKNNETANIDEFLKIFVRVCKQIKVNSERLVDQTRQTFLSGFIKQTKADELVVALRKEKAYKDLDEKGISNNINIEKFFDYIDSSNPPRKYRTKFISDIKNRELTNDSNYYSKFLEILIPNKEDRIRYIMNISNGEDVSEIINNYPYLALYEDCINETHETNTKIEKEYNFKFEDKKISDLLNDKSIKLTYPNWEEIATETALDLLKSDSGNILQKFKIKYITRQNNIFKDSRKADTVDYNENSHEDNEINYDDDKIFNDFIKKKNLTIKSVLDNMKDSWNKILDEEFDEEFDANLSSEEKLELVRTFIKNALISQVTKIADNDDFDFGGMNKESFSVYAEFEKQILEFINNDKTTKEILNMLNNIDVEKLKDAKKISDIINIDENGFPYVNPDYEKELDITNAEADEVPDSNSDNQNQGEQE